MRTIVLAVLTSLAGLLIGGASAVGMSGLWPGTRSGGFFNVEVDGWRSDWAIGGTTANPYVRARVARHGLLAMTREQAVYLTRTTDDAGQILTERCDYRITGTGQDAYWWSITLYDARSRLPDNSDDALSIDATRVGAPREWTAMVSPLPPGTSSGGEGGGWISSRNAGTFDLTLRLYRPSAGVLDDPETNIRAPRVERLTCRGDGR